MDAVKYSCEKCGETFTKERLHKEKSVLVHKVWRNRVRNGWVAGGDVVLCGIAHKQTTQEYFIDWIQGKY